MLFWIVHLRATRRNDHCFEQKEWPQVMNVNDLAGEQAKSLDLNVD